MDARWRFKWVQAPFLNKTFHKAFIIIQNSMYRYKHFPYHALLFKKKDFNMVINNQIDRIKLRMQHFLTSQRSL